jgi:multicomponent K+:H+ antiporter subunit A
MAGVPLLNGFLSKEMFFAETLAKTSHGPMAWLLPAIATLAGIFSVAYSLRFMHDTFFNGEPRDLPRQPHEPPFFMRLPVLLLVLLCVAVGLAPAWLVGPSLAVAAQAALHPLPLPEYKLALWHGLNLPLLMSVIAVVGGVLLYFGLQRFVRLHGVARLPGWVASGGREGFLLLLHAGVGAATVLTRSLQNGHLQRYLLLLVLVALAAGAWPFLAGGPSAAHAALHVQGLNAGLLAIAAIGITATFATAALHRRRLLALVLMGVAGLVVCLVFVWFSAPDLALTQLLVEVVSVVLLMLALRWLPAESPAANATVGDSRARRWRDAVIAAAAGLGIAALAWMVLNRPFDSISPYFLETAKTLGGGANVVNVIIVDYRGFDTLGEITVMVIAAITMHALLGRFVPPPRGGIAMPAAGESERRPLMLQVAARLVLPFALLVSLHLFLRGHNLPGGGFIAGLVLAIALVLQQVAQGQAWVVRRSGSDERAWAAAGLLIAAATGLASWLYGAPFLTSSYDYPWLPGIGGVPLASASAFDLGVYLVVIGATVVMLMAIARLSMPPGAAR